MPPTPEGHQDSSAMNARIVRSPVDLGQCFGCGKPMQRHRGWQRFCSPGCRMKVHRARQAESRDALEALAAIKAIVDTALSGRKVAR